MLMRKQRTKIYQYCLRFKIAWRIFTGKNKHFVMISLDDENFTAALAESLFSDSAYIKTVGFSYVGMCEIHAYYALMFAVGQFDQVDVMIKRAEFQADVDESMLSANKNADGKR